MDAQSKFEGRYSIAMMRNAPTVLGGYRWGWNGMATDFGIGYLHLGPVKLQITWPVVWPY